MSFLNVQNLSKKYNGTSAPAVFDLSFTLERGEILSLLGESGCGKSTALRMIAGFETPDGGLIELEGNILNNEKKCLSAEKRGVGIVFQDAALFPHLTVFDNIAFGIKKQKAKLRKQRVEEMLALVGLSDFGERFPHQISGGQQQRVSIARALAPKPNLLLLDEPFSALDENLKNKLLEDVYKILHKAQVPSIFVTHSVHDALNTADRILILKDGHTQQLGSPHDVYFRPANEYVANFFGKTNILDAETISQGLLTCVGTIPYRHKLPLGEKLKIAVRPEDFLVKTEENCDGICSTVDRVRFCDSGCSELLINVKDQPGIQLCVQCQGDESICPKDNVHVEIVPEKVRILSGS